MQRVSSIRNAPPIAATGNDTIPKVAAISAAAKISRRGGVRSFEPHGIDTAKDTEQIAAIHRADVFSTSLQQQDVAEPHPDAAQLVRQSVARAVQSEDLQAIAVMKLGAAKALPDKRRTRHQHALNHHGILRPQIRIREMHVGLDLDALDVLDAQQIAPRSLDDNFIACRQSGFGAFTSRVLLPRSSLTIE